MLSASISTATERWSRVTDRMSRERDLFLTIVPITPCQRTTLNGNRLASLNKRPGHAMQFAADHTPEGRNCT
jgi:hypothetical protein